MTFLAGLFPLAAAAYFGGWPWALVGAAVLAVLWKLQADWESVLTTFGLSLLWLALFYWSGDRRFFFPYCMQLAVQLGCLLQGRTQRPMVFGGGGIVALFTAIRLWQGATAFVLFVELLVAAIILYLASRAVKRGNEGLVFRTVAGTVASLLAYISLAVN